MDITRYIKTNSDFNDIADASAIRASKAILKAVEIKRDELREQVENNPVESTDINKDIKFKLGMIRGLKWVLELQGHAKDHASHLPEEITL